MKKNLNFLNKVFVIKQPYHRKSNSQFVYFSNGHKMSWCNTDFYVLNKDCSSDATSKIFHFENGIANHSKLSDRVFLENAIKAKYYDNIGYANSLIKYSIDNKSLVNEFIKSGYTYISPIEYKRLDKKLLDIIEYQVNRLDKGEELITNDAEYLKLI